jgi:hypothetical protein
MSSPSHPRKTSTDNVTLAVASSTNVDDKVQDPPSQQDSQSTAATRKRQDAIDAQQSRTIYAVTHSVGLDGALNPLMADGVSPERKFGKPVMRQMENEPLGSRWWRRRRRLVG